MDSDDIGGKYAQDFLKYIKDILYEDCDNI